MFCCLLAIRGFSGNNILLIVADDYGADSSELYNAPAQGATLPPTPNLRSLAQSGLLFANAYAHPVCSPTRSCIITGRHGFRTGVGDAITGPASPNLTAAELTLPEIFAASGSIYRLAQFGKWHLHTGLNSPGNIGGWPHFAGSIPGGLPSYTNWTKTVNGVANLGHTNYATSDIVDDAIAWIQARGAEPWFAWVAFNAGHTPLHKPPDHLHSYDALPGTPAHIAANPRPYFEAMIEAMDTEIGRLLDVVSRDKTHVIFLGDNGTTGQLLQPPYPTGRGKSTLYEGGTKVPFVVSGPEVVNPGRTNASPVHAVDLFSTILELAGIDSESVVSPGTALDSRSLVSILRDQPEGRRTVYTELFGDNVATGRDGRALRNEQYKLVQFASGHEEFYNLAADPFENSNLLAQTLTTDQQAHYYALTLSFRRHVANPEPPVITALGYGDTEFSVTVQGDPAGSYSLWQTPTGDYLSWSPIPTLVVTNGAESVTLIDTNATGDRRFYLIEAVQP